jgi:hypothetical protein
MADNRYFVDIFGDIVAAVRAEYDTVNDREPYYIYGHPKEIAHRLSLKDKSATNKLRKFPLVALFQDFAENHGELLSDDYNLSFTCIIVMSTNKNYTSQERYENTFKPILYPIYELLLKKMDISEYLITVDYELIEHIKTDRLFWGAAGIYGNEGLIFNEYLDAIEINFPNIRVSRDTERECQ